MAIGNHELYHRLERVLFGQAEIRDRVAEMGAAITADFSGQMLSIVTVLQGGALFMADLIRESINDAGPRPITPYYGDVSTSVQRNWHPAESVQAPETPEETDTYMAEVLQGERLL